MTKFLRIKNNKGFTMAETLVAVFVILVAVLAVYSITQETISKIQQSSLRLTAVYLAQEGIEIVRNIRDANWLSGADWDNGLSACDGVNFYQADYNDGSLGICGSSRDFLNIEPAGVGIGGFAYIAGASSTPFIREIRITPVGSDELIVSVKVFWKYRNDIKGPVTVSEHLYKWYQ